MKNTADVVVIGGGVMGVAIGCELARRGAGAVAVLEKKALGAGSSGKSGANIRCHYSHPLTTSMALHGLRTFETFTDVFGGPPVFTRAGLLIIAPPSRRRHLEFVLDLQRRMGVKVNLISKDELREIDPEASLADGEVAAFEEQAGYCDALQVVASYARAARSKGVEIREGSRATRILTRNGKVAGVAATDGEIAAGTVVLAAGPWSAALAETAGFSLPVKPCRVQIAMLRGPCSSGRPRRQPVYCDFVHETYCRPLPGGLLHIGNIDPREERAEVDPDAYNEVADREFVDEMRRKIQLRNPSLQRAAGRGGYGALYSVTPDWHPILDRLPGVEGLFCAVGFSGHGFKMAPAVSRILGEMILDGAAESFDVHALRAARFAEGEPFLDLASAQVMG